MENTGKHKMKKQTKQDDGTKVIKGDLILKKNTVFKTSIKVEGDIRCTAGKWFDIKVLGNIYARNIDAGNIDALDISAGNIDARNIDARNINALDISAGNIDARNINALNISARNIDALNIDARNINALNIIFCDKIKVKLKCLCKALIKDRFSIERKEWKT